MVTVISKQSQDGWLSPCSSFYSETRGAGGCDPPSLPQKESLGLVIETVVDDLGL